MHRLVLLLFFVSIVCLILGLFKPSIFSYFIRGDLTRKKIASIFSLATYVFFLLGSITNPYATNDKIHTLIPFLLITSIVCLILGLFKPSMFSYFIRGDLTRKKIASIFGVATIAFLIVGVIAAPSVKTGKTATTTRENQVNVKTSEVALKVSNPPLVEAAIQGRFEEVKRLLDEGADVNAEDDFGVTSLMQASQKGSVTLVQILLDRGADVTAKDRKGNTAMILASKRGHYKVVNLLEEAYKDKMKQASQDTPTVSSAPNVTQAQSNKETKENQVALDSGEFTNRRGDFKEITEAKNPNNDKGSVSTKAYENQLWANVKKAIESVVDANEEIQAQIRAQVKKPSILTTKSDVYVSTNLDCMKVILISVQQNNLVGLREAISVGLQEGELDMLGEFEQVEFLEYVNDEIFKLRPVGSDKVYYSIRIFFSPEEPK